MKRLVSAGVIPKPVWMEIVEATRPVFSPVTVTSVPEIIYPEDRLRSIFLRRNPDAQRIPINLKAKTKEDRHISDRFVSLQMRFMEEQGLSENKAYEEADRVFAEQKEEMNRVLDEYDTIGSLVNPSIEDEAARAFMASLMDSKRDQKLHQALVEQKEIESSQT